MPRDGVINTVNDLRPMLYNLSIDTMTLSETLNIRESG